MAMQEEHIMDIALNGENFCSAIHRRQRYFVAGASVRTRGATISNLNCHANLNLQDCVESVPGHVESAKPSCCRLLCSVFKGYTSISLILIHSCCFISVLTNTASGKSGKRSPDPLQLPRFSHL
jgi:hypothetical protein